MTLYYLKTNVKSAENAVLYSQGKIYDAIYDFAVSGTLQSDQLPKNLYGKCQPGIGANELKRRDYLHSFGGVPIFSNNLLGSIKDISKEVDFVKTIITAEGVEVEFNIAKILPRVKLLDYKKSGISTTNFLAGNYFVRDIEESFLVAREVSPLCQSTFVVSSKFREACAQKHLNVGFKEVAYS